MTRALKHQSRYFGALVLSVGEVTMCAGISQGTIDFLRALGLEIEDPTVQDDNDADMTDSRDEDDWRESRDEYDW